MSSTIWQIHRWEIFDKIEQMLTTEVLIQTKKLIKMDLTDLNYKKLIN
jgi:hypothetical protein